MLGKRGDEMVEAAMILPLLILTVLSMILLLIYFFTCLCTQVDLHGQLVREAMTPAPVFDIEKKKTETSSETGGIAELLLKTETEARIYVISGADMIRTGELLSLGEKK